MKKLITLLLSLMMTAVTTLPALAADYSFGSGSDTLSGFGTSTSYDEPIVPDPMSENTRRNKDAAYFPPSYGVFSGDIPTDPTSPYHYNLADGGFLIVNQNLPPVGNEDYAPGSGMVSAETPEGLLPSTSQTATLNTTPWYYEDGSIGTLYVERTKKTIKVYEGEDLANLKIGAGHFAATSAWDGNVGLAGHNRGGSAYFSFVKDLQNGDRLTFTTKYGVRTYEVYSKVQVNELDSSSLSWSAENILTLITCIADVPELRYCVQAREVN
jgi:sortase A